MAEMQIKKIMAEREVIQAELANRLGKSLVTVKKTLAGNPTISTLERIADALGVPLWHLFVSPDEVCRESKPTDDFLAIILDGKSFYRADSLAQLKEQIARIEQKSAEDSDSLSAAAQ